MSAFDGPLLAAALLLVVAGVAKIVRPESTVGALHSVSAPASTWSVRILGAGEIALGAAALIIGGVVVDTLVAVAYAAFLTFVLVARRHGGAVASCGCFGREDTPPTGAHVIVTTLAVGVAMMAAATGGHDGLSSLPLQLESAEVIAFAALTAWLGWLALAVMPRLHVVSDH